VLERAGIDLHGVETGTTIKRTLPCSQYNENRVSWHLWLEACYFEVTRAAIPPTSYAAIKATVQVENAR